MVDDAVSAPAGVTVELPDHPRRLGHLALRVRTPSSGTRRTSPPSSLAVPYTQKASFPVTLVSTYTDCGDNGQCKDKGAGNDDKERDLNTTTTVTVPVGPRGDRPSRQDHHGAGHRREQRLRAAGLHRRPGRPGRLLRAAGCAARRPDGGLSRGRDGQPPGGRGSGIGRTTDEVAVRFDVTCLAPGSYSVPLAIGYTAAAPGTATRTVILVVG